jgi:hypothetical protein
MVRVVMDESEKKDPPSPPEEESPVEDLKKGIGLLFRAAKSAAHSAAPREKVEKAFKTGVDDLQKAFDRLQSDKLDGAIKSSLQEIGRAVGNVAQTLERELRGDDDDHDKKS